MNLMIKRTYSPMINWYVIRTKPLKEDRVCCLLNRASFETFNPKINDASYRGLLSTLKVSPLFPTYIFLKTNFDEKDYFHTVKYTRGVTNILCTGNKPAVVPEKIVLTLRTRANPEGIIERPCEFRSGENIKVRKGLLKDLYGIIERPLPKEERVLVLLKLLHHELRAKLHWTEIQRLSIPLFVHQSSYS